MTKPHVSPTQLDSYTKCPEAYRRRYIEGEIIPPGIAILKGKGFHSGAEINMRQKIETHTNLRVSDIVSAAVAAFETESHGGFVLSDEERSRGESRVISEAKDDLAAMADVHAHKQAPDYQPIFVEERVTLELPGPRDLVGIIDVADDKGIVVDFKTAGKRKSQADADDSVQLTVYAAAYKAKTGREPTEVRLDSVIKTKTKTDRQVVSSSRGDADFVALAHRINAVVSAIDSGVFPPATPGAWWCSQKWCGYWSTCRFVNSERKALAEGE